VLHDKRRVCKILVRAKAAFLDDGADAEIAAVVVGACSRAFGIGQLVPVGPDRLVRIHDRLDLGVVLGLRGRLP